MLHEACLQEQQEQNKTAEFSYGANVVEVTYINDSDDIQVTTLSELTNTQSIDKSPLFDGHYNGIAELIFGIGFKTDIGLLVVHLIYHLKFISQASFKCLRCTIEYVGKNYGGQFCALC